METVLEILKIITSIILGAMLGFAFILSLRNYRELVVHRKAICKMLDELDKMMIHQKAEELASNITNIIFGDDKPEDLEKAISDLAEEKGLEVQVIAKKRKAEKKLAKKTTKKSTKKENK